MTAVLVKRWFLLLILAGIGAAGLAPSFLRPVTEFLEPRVVVAAALFLVAWGLESRSLLQTFLQPLPALWAVLLSYGVLPLLGWSAGRLLASPDLRVGLLIITCVPCTLASAVIWTRMAGGNEATALLVVLLTTATSWLATTLWIVSATGTEVQLDAAALMQGLAAIVLVPVGLGQLCRASRTLVGAAQRARVFLGICSRLLIFAMILKAAVDVSLRLREDASAFSVADAAATGLLCLATHGTGWAIGFWSSRLLRFARANRIAVAFSCSQKTLPVAFYLFESYFKAKFPLAVLAIVSYHVGQLVMDTFIAEVLDQRKLPSASGDATEQTLVNQDYPASESAPL